MALNFKTRKERKECEDLLKRKDSSNHELLKTLRTFCQWKILCIANMIDNPKSVWFFLSRTLSDSMVTDYFYLSQLLAQNFLFLFSFSYMQHTESFNKIGEGISLPPLPLKKKKEQDYLSRHFSKNSELNKNLAFFFFFNLFWLYVCVITAPFFFFSICLGYMYT